MGVTFVQDMQPAWNLTEHLNAIATKDGLEMVFSVRTWMNVKMKIITAA